MGVLRVVEVSELEYIPPVTSAVAKAKRAAAPKAMMERILFVLSNSGGVRVRWR